MMLYRFTPQELDAIKRRQDAVFSLLSVLAEIHGMPAEVQLSPDGSGFVLPPQSQGGGYDANS